MKRLINIILALVFGFYGCKSQSSDTTTYNVFDSIKNTTNENNNDLKQVEDKPVKITKDDFLSRIMDYEQNPQTWVYKGELPSIIDFYADWCAPCRITAPIIDELAKEYAGRINFYKVDIQKEKELASIFGIQSIPTFLYCPMEGNPSMASGIGRTTEETKLMFKESIEKLLLVKEDNVLNK